MQNNRKHFISLSLMVLLLSFFSAKSFAKEVCWTRGATQYFNAIHYCVSSVLPSQGRNSFGPENLVDGNKQTAWCEGAPGYGQGQTIIIYIDDGPPFRRLLIQNGYGKSRKSYYENSRLKTVEILTDSGFVTRLQVNDQNGEFPILLPKLAQKWVRLKIISVYPGTKYKDTCLGFIGPDLDYEEIQLHQSPPPQRRIKPDEPRLPVFPKSTNIPSLDDSEDLPVLPMN